MSRYSVYVNGNDICEDEQSLASACGSARAQAERRPGSSVTVARCGEMVARYVFSGGKFTTRWVK